MEYGADRETKDFAKTLMNDREQTVKLTGEALAVIFGAVKITRCKDCKYSRPDDDNEPKYYICLGGPCRYNHVVESFFCQYGKPKEGGDE